MGLLTWRAAFHPNNKFIVESAGKEKARVPSKLAYAGPCPVWGPEERLRVQTVGWKAMPAGRRGQVADSPGLRDE